MGKSINKAEKLTIKALEFKNKKSYKKAVNIILRILSEFPDYKKNNGLTLILSSCYYKLKKYREAIYFANNVLNKKPNVEHASLVKYLSYSNLDQNKKAFNMLFDFLEKYPADLFKDTLKELLEGLLKGYSTAYKDKIIYYSKQNDIPIPSSILNDNVSN